MALSLSDVWTNLTKSVEDKLSVALKDGVQQAVDAGLAALQNATDTGASNAAAPGTFLDKLKTIFQQGIGDSDLGKAAKLSELVKSPWVIVGAIIGGALILRIVVLKR